MGILSNLNKIGVVDLNADELENFNGGWTWVISIVIYVLVEYDDIKRGFQDGYAGESYNY